MRWNNGFLLFEVAIVLLLISILSVIIYGFLQQSLQWQAEARACIKAVDLASNCCERMRQQQFDGGSLPFCNGYTVAIEKKPLTSAGYWTISLSTQERQELRNNFCLPAITIQWQGPLGNKRSYTVTTGFCSPVGREQGDE